MNTNKISCELCGRSVPGGNVVLHRVNPAGVRGIFRCETCMTSSQRKAVDPVVRDILDAIKADNEGEEWKIT